MTETYETECFFNCIKNNFSFETGSEHKVDKFATPYILQEFIVLVSLSRISGYYDWWSMCTVTDNAVYLSWIVIIVIKRSINGAV